MMEGSIQFCLLAALLFAAPNPADAQKIPAYYKFGYSMVLRPRFSGAITSIVYKLNGNLVAEYATNGVPLTYYGGFNGRTKLNTETGELEINSVSEDDIGEYVVEINNQVLPQKFEFKESKEVPKPSVIVKPLACGPALPNCTLLCDGDITESGPVTFYWRMGDGEWKLSEREIYITNDEETKKVLTFSCRMNNTFSQKDSKPEPNPFLEKAADNSSNVGGIVAAVIVILLLILAAVVGYLKRQFLMDCFGVNKGKQSGAGGQDEENPLTGGPPASTGNASKQTSNVDTENGGVGARNGGADAGHGDGGAGHGDGGAGHGDGGAGHGDGGAGHADAGV